MATKFVVGVLISLGGSTFAATMFIDFLGSGQLLSEKTPNPVLNEEESRPPTNSPSADAGATAGEVKVSLIANGMKKKNRDS